MPADPDLSTKGMRRAGPFYLHPYVALKDVGYDDNVRFETAQPQGDFTATASPGVSALLLGGDRGGLVLSQGFEYVAFQENADLNHWNSTSRVRGIFLLKRLGLSLEDRFSSLRGRPNNEIDQRLRQKDNAATASLWLRREGRLGMRSYVRQERIDYPSGDPGAAEAGGRLNRDEGTFSLAGELRILPKTTFVMEGVLQRVEFDDRGQGRDTRASSLLPGFRFDPSASVQGQLKVGVTSLEAPDRPQSNVRTTTGEGSLSTRLGSTARLKGTFSRSLVFSISTENLYYVSTSWSSAYEQFFSHRLSAEIVYGRGLNHYPEEVMRIGPPPFQDIRDDRLSDYQLSMRFRVSDRLAFTLRAQRLVRDSSDDSLDRQRDFYAVGSSYDF